MTISLRRPTTLMQAIHRYRGKRVMGPDSRGTIYGGHCETAWQDEHGTIWLAVAICPEDNERRTKVYLKLSLCTRMD